MILYPTFQFGDIFYISSNQKIDIINHPVTDGFNFNFFVQFFSDGLMESDAWEKFIGALRVKFCENFTILLIRVKFESHFN